MAEQGPGVARTAIAVPSAGQTAPVSRLRVTLLTPSFSDTQIFRTEAVALLAGHLGHSVTVVTTQEGDVVPSLAGTDFARGLRRVTEAELERIVAGETDVLCTIKPLASSLGLGRRLSHRVGTALLVDIDDPDIEVYTVWSGSTRRQSVQRLVRAWRSLPSQAGLALMAKRSVTMVSNPVLQARWGGEVVPHARVDPGEGAPHVSWEPRIAFVGTTRRHKGIGLLREAVAQLAGDGWQLAITAERPPDARPWEDWLGPLDGTLDSARMTSEADVVVVPSEDFGYGRGQLPLKLIDAMLMGRAVVVSSAGPLPWAVGDAGPVFRSGSVPGLVEALRPLRDPAVRTELGRRARADALERYTVGSVAPSFQRALEQALGSARKRTPRGR